MGVYMKNRQDINIYIIATNLVLALLLFLSLFMFAYQVKKGEYAQAIASLQAVIPIAAAWLVLCIADRQLFLENKEKEYQRKLEAVKSLHYLIVIAQDLRAQAGHLAFMLAKEEYYVFPHQLEALAAGVERRYEEMLHEKDAYRFISGDVLNKILGLSGSIFGITNFLRSIAVQASLNSKTVRDIFKQIDKEKIIESVEKNDANILAILEDFYKVRTSL
jgi:hypothetical protein